VQNPYIEQSHRKFETPSEEAAFLHEQARIRQESLGTPEKPVSFERAAGDAVSVYEKKPPEEVVSDDFMMTVNEIEETIIHLSPEHDKQIDELALLIEQKGIKNAISVVQKMGNAHLEDDFHRFLVQYLARSGEVSGLRESSTLFKALDMKLYEVALPRADSAGNERSFGEIVSSMEQFYSGMLSISDQSGAGKEKKHFTFEIALSNFSDEVVFYCAVPAKKAGLFEKQLVGVFPGAVYKEHKEDYNPFQDGGTHAGSVARLSQIPLFPLKTYRKFEYDPLNIILHAFGKIKKEGEGAAIQLVFYPRGEGYNQRYRKALDRIIEGDSPKDAYKEATASLGEEFFGTAKELVFGAKKKRGSDRSEEKTDNSIIERITEKLDSPILDANIRIVASAENYSRAEAIVNELEAAFNQFNEAQNSLVFYPFTGKALGRLLHMFSFRLFDGDETMPLNIAELTTMLHFPVSSVTTGTLKQSKAKTAPPPLSLPKEGVLLGVNEHHGAEADVRFADEDRMRHFYVIGQTGVGKTTILKNMIVQDIEQGKGVCFIDPHGSDVQEILANIPAHRIDDVIYFDPANTAYPMGLNMLEYDRAYPDQKSFVVNEMLSIFNKLFDMKTTGGPMFEQYFRNATMLVIEDPESGSTLLEVSRVMADAEFRKLKLSRCRNPVVVQFWQEIAGKAGGEASLANIVPYITSKFDVFLANDIMRPIVAQEQSAFNFRDVMDGQKILLVNLSKGRLGDINAHLLGLILVGKILMAALSRVDTQERPDFFLYIDEFHTVTTDSISTILSEARKYRLSLNMAHQFISQLDESIKNSVFGNVGSMAVFRTGAEDAEFLESQFAPVFSPDDIMHLENRNAYVKLLVNGYPERPFNIRTLAPKKGTPETVEKLKELSALKYGRPREEIEEDVMRRYRKQL